MKKNKDDSRRPPHFERGSDAHDAARITLILIYQVSVIVTKKTSI
jgi:hypothetical protein